MNDAALLIGSGIAIVAAVLILVRRWSSRRLFIVATVFFAWTAVSLFLDLHHHHGFAARMGWIGLLGAGPLALLLSVVAMVRYGREQSAEPSDG